MVRTVSAVAFAVVAMNVASGMAMPYDDAYDLEAREYYDELDFETREYFDELEARELFSELNEYDAREYYDFDAREYEAVMEYIRDVSKSATVTATTTTAAQTVTVTHTHHPQATSCSRHELKEQEKARAAKKAAEHAAWKAARKAKKEAEKTKKSQEKAAKAEAWKHRHDKNWKPSSSVTATTTTTTATTTTALPTTTHTGTTTTHTGTGTTAVQTGTPVHAAAFSTITPAPVLKAGPNVTITTRTGHHGTVTVEVTTTAPVPECTKGSRFQKLFRHHDSRSYDDEVDTVFARAFDFDDLD